jgi:hypothetical protein
MIQPTIGRVVWFWRQKGLDEPKVEQPNAALVTYVWGDRLVNLVVFDANGNSRGETSVTLLQDDDVGNVYGSFASWMPYQKAVAKGEIAPKLEAKIERLEGRVEERGDDHRD